MNINLRTVQPKDKKILFEWANDRLVRSMSIHEQPISWDVHERWFDKILLDPDILFLIAETKTHGKPVALGSFRVGPAGKVSILIAQNYRGKGYASFVLGKGIQYVRDHTELLRLQALIKPDNIASIKVFEKVGFSFHGTAMVDGKHLIEYVYSLNR